MARRGKTEVLNVRMTSGDMRRLKRVANALSVSVSDAVRSLVRKEDRELAAGGAYGVKAHK